MKSAHKHLKIKIILWWFLTGSCVVIGTRIIRYGFNIQIFKDNFIEEYIIGVLLAIIIGLLRDIRINNI